MTGTTGETKMTLYPLLWDRMIDGAVAVLQEILAAIGLAGIILGALYFMLAISSSRPPAIASREALSWLSVTCNSTCNIAER